MSRRLALRLTRGALAILMACGWLVAPARSMGAATVALACTGVTQLTFQTHSLTLTGSPDFFTFSSLSSSCDGAPSGAVSWSGDGTLELSANCALVVNLHGHFTLTIGAVAFGPMTLVSVGPSLAQAWTFFSTAGPMVGGGVFSWALQVGEISACLSGGTTTMTLTSAFVMAELT